MPRSPIAALAIIFVLACDGPSPSDDAGSLADAGDSGTSAFAPDPPSLPAEVSLPCPDGWEAIPGEDHGCAPWTAEDGPDCTGVEARFPGDAVCARLGPECPAGDWPDDLVDDGATHFVLAGAAAGGDGSRASPYARIGPAVAAATAGDVIAIGKGTYIEHVLVDRAVTLRGACVAESVVQAEAGAAVTVDLTADGAIVRDLSLTGAGLRVDGASAELHQVWVRAATDFGVGLVNAAEISGDELVITDTVPAAGSSLGPGLAVFSGSAAQLERLLVLGSVGFGVALGGMGSSVDLGDTAIRSTAAAGGTGAGIAGSDGTSMTLAQSTIERSAGVGVSASGAMLVMTDVLVRDVETLRADGPGGGGLLINSGANATLERVVVSDGFLGGLWVSDEGTTVTARDLVIRDFVGQASDGFLGSGAIAFSGAQITLEAALIERTAASGLISSGAGTRIEAFDLTVRSTTHQPSNELGGRALTAEEGAFATVTRGLFEDNQESGVHAQMGSTIALTDVMITDTRSNVGRFMGRGISVQSGSTLTLERVALEDNREVSLFLHGDGTTASATHLLVRGTLENECAVDECPTASAGVGIAVTAGANLTLSDFLITRNALTGAQFASATATATRGEISNNPIGVNLQGEGVVLEAISDQVTFRDNDVNLDSSMLSLPDPADAL